MHRVPVEARHVGQVPRRASVRLAHRRVGVRRLAGAVPQNALEQRFTADVLGQTVRR